MDKAELGPLLPASVSILKLTALRCYKVASFASLSKINSRFHNCVLGFPALRILNAFSKMTRDRVSA
jgi:hypothetical protein